MSDEVELYRKHRPRRFKDVLGQPEVVAQLIEWFRSGKVPHVILLSGEAGTGKTTLARIIQRKLGCVGKDYQEINFADARGIDTAREVSRLAGLYPMHGGTCRVWFLDEFARATSDAAASLLKPLEDTPEKAYFILGTTDPQKLSKPILTRCSHLKLMPLSPPVLRQLIANVSGKENFTVPDAVRDAIIEAAEGSARKALVLLHQVRGLADEASQLEAVRKGDSKRQAIELARALLDGKPWKDIAAIIKAVEEEPESLRHLILAYATTVLLGGGKLAGRAYELIGSFSLNFYDTKKAVLLPSLWEFTLPK